MSHSEDALPPHVRWEHSATRPRKPGIPILRIDPERTFELTAVSSKLLRVWVHWTGERHLPCKPAECPYCKLPPTEAPLKLQGWLAMQSWPTKALRLVCLTHFAMQLCPALFDQPSIRGRTFSLRRLTTSSRGKLSVQWLEAVSHNSWLYPEPDVAAVLVAMWESPLRFETVERHQQQRDERLERRSIQAEPAAAELPPPCRDDQGFPG